MADDEPQIDTATAWGVGAAVLGVLTFSTYSQYETARLVGVPWQLAWVLPIATDATELVAARAWMTTARDSGLRRYAATITIACMVLSFLGASGHLLIQRLTLIPDWLLVTIGGLPSLALAALIHLVALMISERDNARTLVRGAARRTRRTAAASAAPTPTTGSPAVPPKPAGEPEPTTEPPGATSHRAGGNPETSREPGGSVVPITSAHHAQGSPTGRRERMVAHLNAHPDATGAELDRTFGTTNYGARVRRAWETQRSQQRNDQASGE
jgi:hypothetical protein